MVIADLRRRTGRVFYHIVGGGHIVVAGAIATFSFLIMMVCLISIFTPSVNVTIGRITYVIGNPFLDNMKFLYTSCFILVLLGVVLLYGISRRIVLLSTSFTLLFIASLYFYEPLSLIPITSVLISLAVYVYRAGALRSFLAGCIYGIAAFEIPALIHYAALFLGLRAPLKQFVSFEQYTWSLMWFAVPFIVIASLVLYIPLSARRAHSKGKQHGGEGGVGILCLAIIASIAIAAIGYIPTVNPFNAPLNVDWYFYYTALKDMMNSENPFMKALTSWTGYSDRPLYLVLLYLSATIFKIDIKALSIYHNIAIAPIYTFSLYFMAKRISGYEVAKYVALLAPITPNALSFLYGGFQANHLSLSLIYIAIGLLLDAKPCKLPAIFILSMASLLTHAWTWIQFSLFTALYMLLIIVERTIASLKGCGSFSRRHIFTVIGSVIFIIAGVVAISIVRSFTARILNPIHLISLLFQRPLALGLDLNLLMKNLEFYHTIYTGGSLNNAVYYTLLILASLTAPFSIEILTYIFAQIVSSYLLYPYHPLYSYRIEINIPTILLTAHVFAKLNRDERALLYIALYTIAIGKVLCFIPQSTL